MEAKRKVGGGRRTGVVDLARACIGTREGKRYGRQGTQPKSARADAKRPPPQKLYQSEQTCELHLESELEAGIRAGRSILDFDLVDASRQRKRLKSNSLASRHQWEKRSLAKDRSTC
eukprot:6213196-Pleurochrysis_carterae.AAC.1